MATSSLLRTLTLRSPRAPSPSSLRTLTALAPTPSPLGRPLPLARPAAPSARPKEQRRWISNKSLPEGLQPKRATDWAQKGDISFDEVRSLSSNPGDVMILDVREPAEIAQGNIPSSLPLPLSVLPRALALDPFQWEQELGFKKPREDQPVVVYCRSGKRSASAKELLETQDKLDARFTNVRNYPGSWLEWSEKYKPGKEEDEDDD